MIVVLTIFLCGVTSSYSQCNAPSLTFNSPTLISGTDGTIGAVYLFPLVIPGVDAHVTVMDIVGGASLAEIDNTTGAGYYDAFQPYVWAGANDTSYLDWKITFKIAGTYIDTFLECLAVTAIDVDGDNSQLKEFVEAATPGSFAIDPYTNLTVSFDGVRSKAEGQITTIPLIDTNHREAMFQMNFSHINSLLYRNGAITTGGSQIRQTCIYFKPFFDTWMLLPLKLSSFAAQKVSDGNLIRWSAVNEQTLNHYTLQKSIDGKNWREINVQFAANSNIESKYSFIDKEITNGACWYRLKQTDMKNTVTYSKTIVVGNNNGIVNTKFSHNSVFSNSVNLNVQSVNADKLEITIYNISGLRIKHQLQLIESGSNQFKLELPANLAKGVYLLAISNNKGKHVYSSRLIKD